MLERQVEAYLASAASQRGGLALKWTSPGNAGVPDRLVILPHGRIGFIELKRPGGRLRPLQVHWQEQLAALGALAAQADSHAGVDAFLDTLEARR